MNGIQNSCIGTLAPFNKAIAGFTCVLAITAIILSIIGLTASPLGPFNVIVQLGTATNGTLLGTSIFVFILDIVWIATLCKKTRERSVLQSETSNQDLSNSESHIYESSKSALVSVNEEINDMDHFSQQPQEIIRRVFGYLSAIELAKCGEVSRRWRRFSSDVTLWNAIDLRKISPLIKVFDESDWSTHFDLSSFGLDVKDAPPLDKRQVIADLKRELASLPIKENAGVTLLTIPKGLTINKLIKMGAITIVTPMGGGIFPGNLVTFVLIKLIE